MQEVLGRIMPFFAIIYIYVLIQYFVNDLLLKYSTGSVFALR
jgi:hypothetical protein